MMTVFSAVMKMSQSAVYCLCNTEFNYFSVTETLVKIEEEVLMEGDSRSLTGKNVYSIQLIFFYSK